MVEVGEGGDLCSGSVMTWCRGRSVALGSPWWSCRSVRDGVAVRVLIWCRSWKLVRFLLRFTCGACHDSRALYGGEREILAAFRVGYLL